MFNEPARVASLMQGFEPDWFVAGGWAIDLFLERETRPHPDIEIAVFRADQFALQAYLQDWDLKKAVGGKLIDWKKGEFLELPVHEVHCFRSGDENPVLEVLLNEKKAAEWIYRRDERIIRSLADLTETTKSGIKFLRPEIVLLYKSKNPRAKDELDFQNTQAHLDFESKAWLRQALSICYSEHLWLDRL